MGHWKNVEHLLRKCKIHLRSKCSTLLTDGCREKSVADASGSDDYCRGSAKSPFKLRHIEWTWLASFCVLLYSITNVGPCTR